MVIGQLNFVYKLNIYGLICVKQFKEKESFYITFEEEINIFRAAKYVINIRIFKFKFISFNHINSSFSFSVSIPLSNWPSVHISYGNHYQLHLSVSFYF